MANGGWYETKEEWGRIEQPLLSIDSIITSFASKHGFTVTKNLKDNPERSITFYVRNVRCLIQIWMTDKEFLTFNLWCCASYDIDGKRYWKNETPIKGKRVSDFKEELESLLIDEHKKLIFWSNNKEQLEFITNIGE